LEFSPASLWTGRKCNLQVAENVILNQYFQVFDDVCMGYARITYFINVVQNISKGNNTGFAAV
jgi:hypothetical protein